MKYYDIGVNLFCRQFSKPEKILANANQANITCILTGSDMHDSRKINAFIQSHDAWGTVGIHPHNADSAKRQDFILLEEMLSENPKLVAVGECGLDFDRMFSSRDNQLNCLDSHITLAKKLKKPLFLHEREASEEFIKVFRHHHEVCQNAVVHCFTGDKKTLEIYLEMGFYIGITGWICDERRAEELRKAVEILPLDRVMLETDSPYLIPRNISRLGRVNIPNNICYVAQELAKYMNIPEQDLIAHANANTEKLFHIS
ncbi:MAG: TatD family hydrolase [Oscillospiraceae bacterium]|nr:TatD family hydrolase [Oscillospiraceae bacterium]MDE6777772.1 TatD family hydrolase [Oscillospiraceae bacterium]